MRKLLYLLLFLPSLLFAQGPIIRNVVTTQSLVSAVGYLTNNGAGVLGFTRDGSFLTNISGVGGTVSNAAALTLNQPLIGQGNGGIASTGAAPFRLLIGAQAELGFTPLTNSFTAITNTLGYHPETNGAALAASNALQTQLDSKQPASANLTNWSLLTTASKQDTLGFVPLTNSFTAITNTLGYKPETNGAANAVSNVLQTQIDGRILTSNGFGTNLTVQGPTTFTNTGATGGGILLYSVASTDRTTITGLSDRLLVSINATAPFQFDSDGSLIVPGIISGDGSGLTDLDASDLATGTVPLARLANINTNQIDQATIALFTNLPTATGGTVSNAAALTANLPLIGQGNGAISSTSVSNFQFLTGIDYTPLANIKHYGAVGDGLIDDRAAIQAAFDSGLSVYIPAGIYLVGNTLSITNQGQYVFGDGQKTNSLGLHGSALIFTNQNAYGIVCSNADFTGLRLKDFMIWGPGQQFTNLTGLYVNGNVGGGGESDGCSFDGLSIWRWGEGMRTDVMGASEIVRCNFYFNGYNGCINISNQTFAVKISQTTMNNSPVLARVFGQNVEFNNCLFGVLNGAVGTVNFWSQYPIEIAGNNLVTSFKNCHLEYWVDPTNVVTSCIYFHPGAGSMLSIEGCDFTDFINNGVAPGCGAYAIKLGDNHCEINNSSINIMTNNTHGHHVESGTDYRSGFIVSGPQRQPFRVLHGTRNYLANQFISMNSGIGVGGVGDPPNAGGVTWMEQEGTQDSRWRIRATRVNPGTGVLNRTNTYDLLAWLHGMDDGTNRLGKLALTNTLSVGSATGVVADPTNQLEVITPAVKVNIGTNGTLYPSNMHVKGISTFVGIVTNQSAIFVDGTGGNNGQIRLGGTGGFMLKNTVGGTTAQFRTPGDGGYVSAEASIFSGNAGLQMLDESVLLRTGFLGLGATADILWSTTAFGTGTADRGISGNTANGGLEINNGTLGVLTNLSVRTLIGNSFESPTNAWTVNTALNLGANYYLSQGAATIGITGIGNLPTSNERYAQLTILATGTVVFTNVAGIKANDFTTSRTITNGNSAVIAIDVIPGRTTNMAIVQFQ